MKWYEAIAEMVKDPTKEFTANGWTWKLVDGKLQGKRLPHHPILLPANISAEDQSKDWTLVIPPPKEYTFKEMVKELLELGNKYYGQCTDKRVSSDQITISGYPKALSSFLYNSIFTDFILDDTLRFHIKPKE